MEVESRLRGVATKALVDGFHEEDVGLNLGHAALREDISAEVQRLAAKPRVRIDFPEFGFGSVSVVPGSDVRIRIGFAGTGSDSDQ